MWIFRPYITKNGVRIYPRNGKVFRFWVDDAATVKNKVAEDKSAMCDTSSAEEE